MRYKSLVAALLLTLPMLGTAQDRYEDRHEAGAPPLDNVSFSYADVLRVDPIYQSTRVREPREECYDTEVRRSSRTDNTTAGTIVGALVGGALGNQVGKGNGRKAATVAGAVAGGVIGRNIDAANNPERSYSERQTRCEVVDDVRDIRQLVGYDVEYRYRGEVYMSRLDYDPGERLRIRVSVTPARP